MTTIALPVWRVVDRGLAVRSVRNAVGPVAQLWPPDHAMRSFHLSDCAGATDHCDGDVDLDARGAITSIFSDEPEDPATP